VKRSDRIFLLLLILTYFYYTILLQHTKHLLYLLRKHRGVISIPMEYFWKLRYWFLIWSRKTPQPTSFIIDGVTRSW